MAVNRQLLEKSYYDAAREIEQKVESEIDSYLSHSFKPLTSLYTIPLSIVSELELRSKKNLCELFMAEGWRLDFRSTQGNNETHYYVEVIPYGC